MSTTTELYKVQDRVAELERELAIRDSRIVELEQAAIECLQTYRESFRLREAANKMFNRLRAVIR